jgi:hypothetical protein
LQVCTKTQSSVPKGLRGLCTKNPTCILNNGAKPLVVQAQYPPTEATLCTESPVAQKTSIPVDAASYRSSKERTSASSPDHLVHRGYSLVAVRGYCRSKSMLVLKKRAAIIAPHPSRSSLAFPRKRREFILPCFLLESHTTKVVFVSSKGRTSSYTSVVFSVCLSAFDDLPAGCWRRKETRRLHPSPYTF